MIRLILVLIGLFAASAAGAQRRDGASHPSVMNTAPAEHEERRILVMLRMAPEHFRPSSDYGGAGGYGDPAAALARRRIATRIARDNHLTLVDSWPMPILGIDCVIMQVPGDEPAKTVADRLSHDRRVAWSQPLNAFEAQGASSAKGVPNDRLFAAQPSARQWRLAALHRVATGRGVRVAVIDSLVDAGHPDLKGQLIAVRDFVGRDSLSAESHGTGVAGIIAAAANNTVGIAGVAPGARLLALRACWQQSQATTRCDTLSLARALVFALESNAHVINMSLTGPQDQLVARLIQIALRRGVSVVAAADPGSGRGFPASLPGVIAVARDDLAGARSGVYSAPGRDVPTTEAGGGWNLVDGNSFAAAHVSGLLALAGQVGGDRGRRALTTGRAGGSVDACTTLLRAGAKIGARCD